MPFFSLGAEDLKGHVMKLRGDLLRNNRLFELEAQGINVLLEQAAHELKYGDASVRYLYILFLENSFDYFSDFLTFRKLCPISREE